MSDIRRFNPDEDSKHIASWLRDRGMSAEMSTNLPELGLIVYKTGCPVVAGFLRKIEGGYAMLDSLITNPVVLPEIRDKMIDYLVKELISLAKSEGIKAITAASLDENTLLRSIRHGFVKQAHTVITLNLS